MHADGFSLSGRRAMETLTKYAAVAVGGALGAMLRYALGNTVLGRVAAPFPTATLVINVTGSFLLGLFLTLAAERVNLSPHLRLAFAVGFVGAYTTFSTFEWETAKLFETGDWGRALLYVGLSFVLGLVAVWAGINTARRLGHAPMSRFAHHVVRGDEAALSDVELTAQAQPKGGRAADA
jgi:fluoride exporter